MFITHFMLKGLLMKKKKANEFVQKKSNFQKENNKKSMVI